MSDHTAKIGQERDQGLGGNGDAELGGLDGTTPPSPGRAGDVRCTGDANCPAIIHIHGCYSDYGPAACDSPEEHRRGQ